MTRKRPELVAPSGDWESLHSAVASGADAVYFGIKGFNMRRSAENFDVLEMKKIIDLLHKNRMKGYLALNTIVYDSEVEKVVKVLAAAKEAEVDAVILWDMAVLRIAKDLGINTHLSTQASVSNFEALKFYSSLGVKRIVLARECTLADIADIRRRVQKEKVPCRIEAFIHGAMCLSVSGRCLLSQDTFGKSANRGECLQPCRREFAITDDQKECDYSLGERYILSSKDLCTIDFFDKLIKSGIDAFKIEGRIRPPEYVRVVTLVYRKAIDFFFDDGLDQKKKTELKEELKKVFNRGFSSGFYFGAPKGKVGNARGKYEKTYAGEVIKFYKKIGVAEISVKSGELSVGQKILIAGKGTPADFAEIEEMQVEHRAVNTVHKGGKVGIKLPFEVRKKDKVFLWKDG